MYEDHHHLRAMCNGCPQYLLHHQMLEKKESGNCHHQLHCTGTRFGLFPGCMSSTASATLLLSPRRNDVTYSFRVVGSSNGPRRLTTLAYGRAGAYCACSRCGTGGLYIIFSSRLSYLPFLMPHILGDGWTY